MVKTKVTVVKIGVMLLSMVLALIVILALLQEHLSFVDWLTLVTMVIGNSILVRKVFFAKWKGNTAVDTVFEMFTVLLLVCVLRAFVGEGFRIPSGSMKPSLLIGDLIFVNKFTYNTKLPIFNFSIREHQAPKRGDVIVFQHPDNAKMDYIKRIVGVPNDRIAYKNKSLYINGVEVEKSLLTQDFDIVTGKLNQESDKEYYLNKKLYPHGATFKTSWLKKDTQVELPLIQDVFLENLDGVKHQIFINNSREGRDVEELIVPENNYFVLGDNRDNSGDSRSWGFVPHKLIIGKATHIVLSIDFDHWKLRTDRFLKKINE